jgi:hypothetical protein
MKRKLAGLFLTLHKHKRILIMFVLACPVLWAGKIAYDRLTASDARWKAEMLQGDQAEDQYHYLEAFTHYQKALHEAKKYSSQNMRVVKSTIKESRMLIHLVLQYSDTPCNIQQIQNMSFLEYIDSLRDFPIYQQTNIKQEN